MKKIITIKILCILLTAVLLISSSIICFADKDEKGREMNSADFPTIIITGYFMPGLYTDYGTENQKEMWAQKKTIPQSEAE